MKLSNIYLACLGCLFFSASYAAENNSRELIVASDGNTAVPEVESYGSSSKGYEEKYFSGPEYVLSAQERQQSK